MKNSYKIKISVIFLLLLLAGYSVIGQTVTTDNYNTITFTSAHVGATVTNVGTGITERGVCYSTILNPTTADTKVIDPGTGLGSYDLLLTGLTNAITYHVRAYVISGGIPTYGNDLSFTTFATGTFPYSCKAQNDALVDATTYQFDVFIYSNDNPGDLWLNNYQLSFKIFNIGTIAGTLTGSFVTGTSDLPAAFQPATTPTIFRAEGVTNFAMVIAGPPATSNGTLIPYSASGPGTRIGTFRIVYHSGGVVSAFPNVKLDIVWDNSVLGKTIIYAITPAGATGTVLNNSNFSAHLPQIAGSPLNDPLFNTAQWAGTTSTDWNTASNWKANPISAVPTSATELLIPGGLTQYPVLNSFDASHSGIIQDGGNITIANNGSFTANGNLTLGTTAGGPLVIQSASDGTTGSLITLGTISGTGTSTVQVQRYLTANAWHLISAPIGNAVSGMYLSQFLMPFVESTNLWGNFITDLTTPLTAGTGFMCWPITSQAFTYIGNLNTGTISPGVTWANITHGNNFVGNPYPSAIDWNAATGWTKTNLGPSTWVWNQATLNYAAWDGTTSTNGGSRYFAVGQGFFVLAIAASPVLSMNDTVRVHNTQAFLKNSDPENVLKLHIANTSGSDEIAVRFDPSSSWIYDPGIDTRKMFGEPAAPQLYSFKPSDPQELSINVMPEVINTLVVPVGLNSGLNDEFTITASQMESFSPDISMYLEDIKLGIMQDLRVYPVYDFETDSADNAHRFNLHFTNFPFGIPGLESDNGMQIYSYGQSIYVKSNALNENAQLFVYDELGRTLYQKAFKVISLNRFDLSLNQGYYVVKIVTASGVYTKKTYIN